MASIHLLLVCLTVSTVMANIISNIGKDVNKLVEDVKDPIDKAVTYIGSKECSTVKRMIGVSYDEMKDGDTEPDVDHLTLEIKDKSGPTVFKINEAAKKVPQSRDYNPQQKVYLFVHGFIEDPNLASFSSVSHALLKDGKHNVLALDGSSLIRWLYLRSSTYVRFIGEKLGEVLANMVKRNVNPKHIHVIGHSLGAHISGFTGKRFKELTGQRLGRITGLDPAGPCFSTVREEHRLNATDADYVDVIHSDGGVYGMSEPVGQADYYPNQGTEQPNCLLQTCSHARSWVYFSESVINSTSFPAVKCKDWEAFTQSRCNNNDISYMGFLSKPGTKGNYYLQTNDESPFGRGETGMMYKNDGLVQKIEEQLFGI